MRDTSRRRHRLNLFLGEGLNAQVEQLAGRLPLIAKGALARELMRLGLERVNEDGVAVLLEQRQGPQSVGAFLTGEEDDA